ncbi:MAG: 30S ribosomal protein S4 [Oscillospiraceae bacterium]|jgi:ribosomal protein S4|uniref:30S ribosomal protein S4 n=1 Tax=Candidatus Limivicinus sp. TaxID=3030905 RepID=UPI000D798D26|nr:30S ribosomal protein S4 [Clostridiales bacterium]MDY4224733.1 30S ribosomal protein S4 [Candidatus Limivicinus sp.]MED9993200.1 30S ribosomal protein S4 [Oscillospiraceae bacterium]PWL76422.1 MAG: 30S ribosomal protein S4 [Clostridiales bacterium]
MAKNTQPIVKRAKALGVTPASLGYTGKSKVDTIRNPKAQVRKKQSEYGMQLNEKQKVKFIYGVLEKQFRLYYERAEKMPGITGENLLAILEQRLDNVVFRLGFAMTRREARQLVNHGHVTVNGRKVNIPSFQVKPGMVISLTEKGKSMQKVKENIEDNAFRPAPKWIEYDKNNMTAKIVAVPARDDIDMPIEEHLIVELYSK